MVKMVNLMSYGFYHNKKKWGKKKIAKQVKDRESGSRRDVQ